MAHIVTLKDNNDEISYPITPVDAVFVDSNTTLDDALDEKADIDLVNVNAGAVTTTKIADGAVTNDKIDYTTLYGGSSIAHTSTSFNFGPFTGTIHRYGNICWTTGSTVISSWASGNRVDTGKVMISGYRPTIGDVIIACYNMDGQYADNLCTITIMSDYKIRRSSNHAISGATRIDFYGMWFTTDAWPSS